VASGDADHKLPGIQDVALESLWRVTESDSGWPSFLAASEILKGASAHGGRPALVSAEGSALSTLVRGIESASAPTAASAIEVAPLDRPRVREAVLAAASSDKPLVAVAAQARIALEPVHMTSTQRETSLATLAKHATSGAAESEAALDALVRLRDARARPLLEAAMKAAEPTRRARLASAFVSLGDGPAAARFLVDSDATVRVAAACAILSAGDR
jgi:hypothetical protein